MTWGQVLPLLVSGTVLGALVTAAFSAARERKNRKNVHLARLLDQRYKLYLEYLELLDRNASFYMNTVSLGHDLGEFVVKLTSLEHSMQVFASNLVIEAFGEYRKIVFRLADWDALDDDERQDLIRVYIAAVAMSRAAIRSDLRIDKHENWFTRSLETARVVRRVKQQEPEINRLAEKRFKFHRERSSDVPDGDDRSHHPDS